MKTVREYVSRVVKDRPFLTEKATYWKIMGIKIV